MKIKIQASNLKLLASIAFCYLAVTIFFTWPLVLDLKGSVYGYPGDSFGYIYYLWWWKYAIKNGLDVTDNFLQEAPVGMPLLPNAGTIGFLWPTKALTWVFDEVISYNLNLLLTFPLTGIFTYLLAYKITRSKAASFFAGFVLTFSPYHIWKTYNHLDLAMIHWLPLYFWGLLNLIEKKSLKWGILTGAFYSLIILTNFYYAYFAFFATILFGGTLLIKEILSSTQKKELIFSFIRSLAYLLVIPVVVMVFVVFPSIKEMREVPKERQGDIFERPLENLITLSSRPWDYLLPSEDHPLLGEFGERTYQWIEGLSADWKTRSTYTHEKTAFVGYFSIIFGLTAIYLGVKNKIKNKYLVPLIITIFGIVFLSAPPYIIIRGLTIRFPSFYLYKIFPMFRAYARLGVLVTLFVALLGSIGVGFVLAKIRKRVVKIALVIFAAAFIIFEFANFPPAKITRIEPVPEVYQWLAEQSGDFIIIEYPKLVNIADIEIYQRYHLKRLANPHDLSPQFKIWEDLKDLFDEETPKHLRELGVKYVIVHKKLLFETPNPVDDMWHMRAYNVEEMDYSKLPEGLRIVRRFEKEDVLEVL